ncbi:LacI family DNA-binding transcriptional regulator [Halalkalibacter okhensis]|uniref:LacI family transcriptional regulator n=1 Tax=Halalkalibacter okhensis TaxID=333138 RepID=A0A0B0IA74_9BACI|nr:substrate-binding domain-containing protein [Halalkalibacter okhensis]KHF39428.1 LacI family transcriptional regulator [Halalkalibacter okhensis]
MKTVTITDVAKHANVSKSTVSQYLNKRFDYMGEKTRERIAVAIKELGYQPNIVARSLKQKSTSTIGVIVANILHAFSTQVIRAIEDYCHESDFHIIVCNADDNPDKEKKYIEMLLAKQVDGLIVFPTGDNVELYEKMVKDQFPIVFVDRTVDSVNVPAIVLDNEKASSLAVSHLAEKGYERIGIITPSLIKGVTARMGRINGFRQSVKEQNLPIIEDFIKSVEINEVQSTLEKMMTLPVPPQAILAGNDRVLMEILKYTKANSINIPNDLAIIGIDDVSFASIYSPALTVVSQPAFEMGKQAATLILSFIQKKEEKTLVYTFEPTLISRESC